LFARPLLNRSVKDATPSAHVRQVEADAVAGIFDLVIGKSLFKA